MKRNKQKRGVPASIGTTKEQNRIMRQDNSVKEQEYMAAFIRPSESPARNGKMAYVRQEYHDRIMRITHVIGKGKLSLSAYIDHVLTQHFAENEDVIRSLYKKNYENIII